MFTRRTLLKSGAALAAASTMTGLAKPAFAAGTKIKIGYVSPQSGPLSAFSAADDFMVKKFLDSAAALGLDASVMGPVQSMGNFQTSAHSKLSASSV